MLPISRNHTTYLTKPASVSVFSRQFPSLSFYPALVSTVYRASIKARRGIFDYDAWGASSLEVLRRLEKVGVQFHISGFEHVKAVDGPVIFIGNHLSVLETMILPSLIVPYRPVTYVVKQSLVEYPVFKHVMRSRNPIVVTRTNPRKDLKAVLGEGQERLSRGVSIIIFPQTTRTAFDPRQFSTIGIKLAKRSGVPVIPLALLTDAWGNGKRLKDFGKIDPAKKVYLAFGKQLEIDGKGTEEHQFVIDFIQDHLAQWQGRTTLV